MKTQIIQLEAHDDVISTRDKMGAGQASRILLVWPAKTHLLNRQLDLILLQRHSNRLGAQLGLVTTDEEVRFFGRELGLPVFGSLKQAQGNRWRPPRRRRWRPNQPQTRFGTGLQRLVLTNQTPAILLQPFVRLAIFSISILSLLILIVILLPGARITLQPHREQQTVTLNVRTNPTLNEPLLVGELPVQHATVIVEGRDSLPASGKILVPEKPASGEVVFTNLTQGSVDIPQGTIVTTLEAPVIRFTTTKEATVRAGIDQTVTVPIQAIVPGLASNLAANRLQAIEGPLGLSLTVNNPKPTFQGTDRPAVSPTPKDRENLYYQLLGNLEQTAQEEIKRRIPVNGELSDFPLLSTLHLGQVVEETYSPTEDSPADQVNLLLRLEFDYQFVSAADLQKLAAPILAASIPQGFHSIPQTLRIEHHPINFNSAGIASWQLILYQEVENVVTPPQAAAIAHGLSVEQARKELQAALELDKSPQITIMPSWWPFLPYLPFRIDVSLQPTDS